MLSCNFGFKGFAYIFDVWIFLQIRRQAIKELPNLCKASPENHFHIADVLTQLLQSDDPQDTSTVNSALMALFKLDAESKCENLYLKVVSLCMWPLK